eukprot:jgi/Mesvir1/15403/Mv06588-RA.1
MSAPRMWVWMRRVCQSSALCSPRVPHWRHFSVGTEAVYRSHLTPIKFLERSANVFRDKDAIKLDGTAFTYGQFFDRASKLAGGLIASGVRPGDRVAIVCRNLPEHLEAHFGVPMAGALLVSINTRLSPREMGTILAHSGASILLVDSALASNVAHIPGLAHTPGSGLAATVGGMGCPTSGSGGGGGASDDGALSGLRKIVTICEDPSHTVHEHLFPRGVTYEEFLKSGESVAVDPQGRLQHEEDSIAINYTSGTTGAPKGVLYSHRGVYLNAIGEAMESGLNSSSKYLWTLPMFHCNGWCHPWAVTAVGATHVCLRHFDPQHAWRVILEERITHMCGAPIVLHSLAHSPHAPRPGELPQTLTIVTAGAPPSPTLLARMESLNVDVRHMYGLTETYGPHTVCAVQDTWRGLPLAERAAKVSRQGVGMICADPVRVVDGDMRDVPRDGATMGEVVMRGNNVMKGYFSDPRATERAFHGGWFHSGDLAVMHPDGYIELRDRSKDVIITGGENVSSIEVAQILERHPAVMEVAVIGVPHPKWGETPKAFVKLWPSHASPGSSPPGPSAAAASPAEGVTGGSINHAKAVEKQAASVSEGGAHDTDALAAHCQLMEKELITFCRQNLSHYKCPTAVQFVQELPKTSTGKIQKHILRDKEWMGHGTMRIQGS